MPNCSPTAPEQHFQSRTSAEKSATYCRSVESCAPRSMPPIQARTQGGGGWGGSGEPLFGRADDEKNTWMKRFYVRYTVNTRCVIVPAHDLRRRAAVESATDWFCIPDESVAMTRTRATWAFGYRAGTEDSKPADVFHCVVWSLVSLRDSFLFPIELVLFWSKFHSVLAGCHDRVE